MQFEPTSAGPWWQREFHAAALDDTRLDRAAMLLAAHRSTLVQHPDDVNRWVRHLDQLAAPVAATFDSWHRTLFVDQAFTGNGIDYHDVRNSFLPDVLSRKVGIPISLAVIALEVARRCGLVSHGIGMPGHFLLRVGGSVYVDPFTGGTTLTERECVDKFRSMFADQPFESAFLAPVTTTQVLVRMLANLKQNYARARDIQGLCDVMRLRSSLPDMSITEARELARLLHATGAADEAMEIIDAVERTHPATGELMEAERARITASWN